MPPESPTPSTAPALEQSVVSRARLGDVQAFATIVERFYPRCMRFARGVLHDPADAEDVVQEAFVRVYRALPRYEERDRFDAWLFRILGNCCRSANTAQRRRRGHEVGGDEELERLAGPDSTDAFVESEWGEEVRKALAELPEHNREIFLLHYIEGFDYYEIERITGVRRSALKMRVKRASDFLRTRLAGVYRG